MKLALTFDAEHPDMAGSDPDVVRSILDELDRASLQATFFVQGRWATAFPHEARAIAKAGHQIGSHSHYHADMRLMTPAGVEADLGRARAAIMTSAGVDPQPWFRFPFGFGIDDEDAQRAIASAGYRHYLWDCDSLDWQGSSVRQILKQVSKVTRSNEETIALFHTWPVATPEAVRRIIEWARERSIELVTVDKLSQDHSGFGLHVFTPSTRDIPGLETA